MRYYFKLSDDLAREEAILRGKQPKPIKLYPETPAIAWSAEHNMQSDWWGVYRFGTPSTEWADFDSKEEAEAEYYTTSGVELYEKMNYL